MGAAIWTQRKIQAYPAHKNYSLISTFTVLLPKFCRRWSCVPPNHSSSLLLWPLLLSKLYLVAIDAPSKSPKQWPVRKPHLQNHSGISTTLKIRSASSAHKFLTIAMNPVLDLNSFCIITTKFKNLIIMHYLGSALFFFFMRLVMHARTLISYGSIFVLGFHLIVHKFQWKHTIASAKSILYDRMSVYNYFLPCLWRWPLEMGVVQFSALYLDNGMV